MLFAGEVFPVKHLRAVQQRWPHPVYYNLYGPTETNVCTFARIPARVPDDRDTPYPIGFACSHCAPLVLDGDGQEVAAGDEGLLYISGPSVFQGYWNRPEVNSTRLSRARRPALVQHRRRRPLGSGRGLHLRRPPRSDGQAARLPDRARRDRARALPAPAGARSRRHLGGRPGRRREDRRVSVVPRRREPVDHRDEDVLRVAPAGLHEPGPVRVPRAASADLDRQGRLPGAALRRPLR